MSENKVYSNHSKDKTKLTRKSYLSFGVLKPVLKKQNSVTAHLKRYMELAKKLRSSDKLFISYTKPEAISKDTVSRWCKTVVGLSVTDIQNYSTHYTRSAVSSKVKSMRVPLKNIKCARWKSEKTFAQHYEE